MVVVDIVFQCGGGIVGVGIVYDLFWNWVGFFGYLFEDGFGDVVVGMLVGCVFSVGELVYEVVIGFMGQFF